MKVFLFIILSIASFYVIINIIAWLNWIVSIIFYLLIFYVIYEWIIIPIKSFIKKEPVIRKERVKIKINIFKHIDFFFFRKTLIRKKLIKVIKAARLYDNRTDSRVIYPTAIICENDINFIIKLDCYLISEYRVRQSIEYMKTVFRQYQFVNFEWDRGLAIITFTK